MQSASVNQPTIRKKRSRINCDYKGYFFVAPFFIVFLIFGLYPIYFTFRTALTDAVGWEHIMKNNIIGFKIQQINLSLQ